MMYVQSIDIETEKQGRWKAILYIPRSVITPLTPSTPKEELPSYAYEEKCRKCCPQTCAFNISEPILDF